MTDAADAVYEHDDTFANEAHAGHTTNVMTRPYADLVVEWVDAEATALSGTSTTVSWTVRNVGPGITDVVQWSDRVYLSTDPTGATGRTLLGTFERVGSLGTDDSYVRSVSVDLPDDAGGVYYLVVETSGPYEFVYTDNNRSVSSAMTVTYVAPADVDLEVVSVVAPDSAVDAEWIDVTWTVRNAGPDDCGGSWQDRVLLAPNGDVSQAIELGSFQRLGGLDANTSYTRTERVQLPEAQGLYTVVVVTDVADAVVETDEENNTTTASTATTLSISARPDLQATALVAPASVQVGAVIDVQWTVTNLGTVDTPTGQSRWYDTVYISMDHQWDAGDLVLGVVQNGSALASGESYTTTAQFQLPDTVAGNVYVIVKTDQSSDLTESDLVEEFPNEDNNALAVALAVDATPVPPPDLVTSNVTTPVEAYDGSTITIRYRVTNLGAGVTYPSSWSDTIWLCFETGRPNANRETNPDIPLLTVTHDDALEVGEYYDAEILVDLPTQTRGVYYITVWSDSGDAVYEVAFDTNVNPDAPLDPEGSNFASGELTILYTPPADLVVSDVQAPTDAVGGQTVSLTWTVTNQGLQATDLDLWGDAIYISTDATLHDDVGEEWLVFGVPHSGVLAAGESYTETFEFLLPPSAKGAYFIVETNVSPKVLMSEEQLFEDEAQAIVDRMTEVVGGPLENADLSDLQDLTMEDLMYALLGDGDERGTVFEGPWTDNNALAAACLIDSEPADLVVANLSVPAVVYSGEVAEITWTVENQGEAIWSGNEVWYDWVFISPDPEFIFERATLVEAVPHVSNGSFDTGDSYTASCSLPIAAGVEGRLFVYVFSDWRLSPGGWGIPPSFTPGTPLIGEYPEWPDEHRERVWEDGQKDNNVACVETLAVYAEPDLQVTDLTVVATAWSGDTIDLSWTVTNDGTHATRVAKWYDRVYISQDPTLDDYDELLASVLHDGGVGVGESYTVDGTVRLPDDIEGTFYLLIYVDSPVVVDEYVTGPVLPYPSTEGSHRLCVAGNPMGRVLEFDDEDNDILAQPIEITLVEPSDLRVTAVTAPTQLYLGRSFEVTYTVTNVGTGDIPDRQTPWTDYVYLSRDRYLDAGSDYFLGLVEHDGVLAAGGSYTVSVTFDSPEELLGQYYIFVVTDVPDLEHPRGIVYELGGESNNASATALPMLIDLPPPSDLQVDSIAVPAPADVGEEITITWIVTNHSSTEDATGRWADAVYLSADAVWDLGDLRLGTVDIEEVLNPGGSYSASLTVMLPPALAADYRLIVRTDVYDDVYESVWNANNLTVSPDRLTVGVPTLVLGEATQVALPVGADLLFRVDVAADETLQLELTCSEEQAANELFAGYEFVPSSAAYDAMYEGHLWADQTILVAETHGGTYYVRLRNAGVLEGASGAAMTIELLASLLPFAITDVTPDSGGAEELRDGDDPRGEVR